MDDPEVWNTLKTFDYNGDGYIEVPEFIRGMAQMAKERCGDQTAVTFRPESPLTDGHIPIGKSVLNDALEGLCRPDSCLHAHSICLQVISSSDSRVIQTR